MTQASKSPLGVPFVFVKPGLSQQTDEELVRLSLGEGGEQAFKELFERHRRLAARLASRFFYQPEMIEEIVQVSFIKTWFSLDKYLSKSEQNRRENGFVSWLSRITINTCYDQLRAAYRQKESKFSDLTEEEEDRLSEELNDQGRDNAERAAISRDLAQKLLARLDPEDQVVLILLKAEGLSVAEISELTGWSKAKVKMRVHRAKAIFQKTSRRLSQKK